MPLQKLLEQDLRQFQPRQATTVHKLLQILGGIVSKAEREGFLDKVVGFVNPFGKGIRYSIEQRALARKLFDKPDLAVIFSSPVFVQKLRPQGGGNEAAFWFPLIALFSGLRLDEIAQLRICDIRKDEDTGRWFFDIDRTGGRTTKSFSSIRYVPVHSELERIGLLRYRENLIGRQSKLEKSMWPEVMAKGERPRSAAWSKWFGRYLRETCGIADTSKVFHSFRHTFKRMTRDAGLPEEQHDALTGHSGSGSVGRSYGKGLSLGPLIDAMDKVVAPLSLAHLSFQKA
jgi:integrase